MSKNEGNQKLKFFKPSELARGMNAPFISSFFHYPHPQVVRPNP